jgi:uncharacterized protein YqgC (DUF456 family)
MPQFNDDSDSRESNHKRSVVSETKIASNNAVANSAIAGASAGALIGSVIPGFGTLLGGVIGAVIASAAKARDNQS